MLVPVKRGEGMIPGPCPAPGDTGVFRERGGAEGIRRVEGKARGRTREQGVTKAGTSLTMLPPLIYLPAKLEFTASKEIVCFPMPCLFNQQRYSASNQRTHCKFGCHQPPKQKSAVSSMINKVTGPKPCYN